MESETTLLQAFKEYWNEHGHAPRTEWVLAQKVGIPESEFFDKYASLEALEQEIWYQYVMDTLQRMEGDEAYQEYGAREKVLAFYYTLFEILKSERSYTRRRLEELGPLHMNPNFLGRFKKAFLTWLEMILREGEESGEVKSRWMLSSRYGKAHWPQCTFLLHQWAKDSSEAFQQSDEAVEKTVNLGFDAMGHTVFDSAFQWAKFLWQKGG